MLGNSTTQQLFRESYSISVTPKIVAEWNHNIYNKPRVCGALTNDPSVDTATPNLNNLVDISSTWTTLNETYRDSPSDLNSVSIEETIGTSPSNKFQFSANRSYAYKISFYLKTTSTTSDYATLHFNEYANTTDLKEGSSKRFAMSNTDWTFCEMFYSPVSDLSNNVIVSLSADESSIKVYLSDITIVQIDRNEYKTQHLFKTADVFSGFRPGDEISEAGIDRELSSVIYRNSMIKKHAYRLTSVSATRSSYTVTATKSSHGISVGDYVIASGFTTASLNGRFLVISTTSTTFTYKTLSSGTVSSDSGNIEVVRVKSSPFAKNIYANSDKRIYLPGIDKISYYMDTVADDSSVSGIFSYYDKPLTTNKIVIKMLNSGENSLSPAMNSNYGNTLVQYSLHTYDGTSWTTHEDFGTVDKNGYLETYWDGTAWGSTKSLAQIDESTLTIDGTTDIIGIAFSVSSIGYVSGGQNYTANSTNKNIPDTTVRYLELSPRLEVDLSTYLVDFSTSRETDNGSLPIPVGLATANSADVTLENIPRSHDGSTYSIFSGDTLSPLKGLINRDIKFKITYSIGEDSDIKFFTGFVDNWIISDDSVQISMFDGAKYLQKQRNRDLMLMMSSSSPLTIGGIIKELLDQNGFSDYRDLPDMGETIVNYYADRQSTVWENIQSLILPYSYMGFFDEDGMLKFTSYKDASIQSPASLLTDTSATFDGDDYIPNIESLSIEKGDQASEIAVRYKYVYRNVSADVDSSGKDVLDGFSLISTANQLMWEAPDTEGLGFSTLKSNITATDRIIPLDAAEWNTNVRRQWVSYSGYALIGSEIISYDGLEYNYSDSTVIIKSQQEFEALKGAVETNRDSESTFKYKIIPTGRLMNVERGLFGTKAQAHYANVTTASVVQNYPSLTIQTKSGSTITTKASPEAYLGIDTISDDKVIKLTGASSTKTDITSLTFSNSDSSSFQTYMFSFNMPASTTASSSADDIVGLLIGYDQGNGSGLYIELCPETNISAKTKFYIDGTYAGYSNFKLDTSSLNDKGKVKEIYTKLQNVSVSIDKNNVVRVKVNGKNLPILNKTTNKSMKFIYNGNRNGKSIGVYVKGKNSLDVQSIVAWATDSLVVSPTLSYKNNGISAIVNKGAVDGVQPFYFSGSSHVHGMSIFDIDYTGGPGYSPLAFKPVGQHEVKNKNGIGTTLINVPETSTFISEIESSPFRAKFAILNVSNSYIPLKSTQSNFAPLMITAKALVKSEEQVFRKTIPGSISTSNPIELTSDWIQSESNARKCAEKISQAIKTSSDMYNVNIFGNPLIQIGDIVKLQYSLSNIVVGDSYIVVRANTSYDSGFETSLGLRKLVR